MNGEYNYIYVAGPYGAAGFPGGLPASLMGLTGLQGAMTGMNPFGRGMPPFGPDGLPGGLRLPGQMPVPPAFLPGGNDKPFVIYHNRVVIVFKFFVILWYV